MSATLLSNELTTLISEAKRKNNDLKVAAEKALQDLKVLPSTSEAQLVADLSRRPNLIEPFLLACRTKNVKLATSGVTCLQRLVVTKALPKGRLNDALDAFNDCADLNLDVQLKVLQALPSLLQNYADELTDALLAGALQICASLQSAKVQTVSGVATATLQQLVTSVFEKVAVEDRNASSITTVVEIPGDGDPLPLRPAAHDAYRLFRDLVLRAEDRQTTFVQLTSLSSDASLELIWSSVNANGKLFESHPELSSVIRSNLLPLVTRSLSERLSFPFTVRSLRILDLVFGRYLIKFSEECEVALGLMVHDIDSDSAPAWKRALVMECIRNVFSSGSLIVDAYMVFDHQSNGKPIVQDLMSSFVRLSSEKPAAIGLGQQSSVPIGPVQHREPGTSDQAAIEAAGGMAGVISSAFGVAEANIPGISSQWSVPRVASLDQLDKTEPPTPPETYIYAMVLDCLTSMSETLARAVLPLTVRHENGSKGDEPDQPSPDSGISGRPTSRSKRSQSFRKLAVPLNPLESQSPASGSRIHAVASLVESCWPAVLATASTFLNAALEDSYYRNLIKAYQRFVQVAGLLRLRTPRDALMTTLSKSAVPPHVLNAATAEPPKSPGLKSPVAESPRVFTNPKSLLSVDSLVSQALDRDRRSTAESNRPMLTTRNLLCLRALLNVAIALGPTLDTAFAVVFDALKQADMVLSMAGPSTFGKSSTSSSQKAADSPAAVQAFTSEVSAVEAAASRLLESTADYPNDAFVTVVAAFCRFLRGKQSADVSSPTGEDPPSPSPQSPHTRRTLSGLPGVNMMVELQTRDYQFVIPKLGSLAQMNINRFVNNDQEESGWLMLVGELSKVASSASRPREARLAAADVLCKMSAGTIGEAANEDEDLRSAVQSRALSILRQILDWIYCEEDSPAHTDYEIQNHVLDALRSILERSGESLVSGWTQVISILASAFERSRQGEAYIQTGAFVWDSVGTSLVAVSVGRNAFTATQLMCSDFLSSLPVVAIPDMVELLCRFMEQTDDLNVALTTVTMAWNVSDFLFDVLDLGELDSLVKAASSHDDLERSVVAAAQLSRSAQFLLLLLFLRDVTCRAANNVRNAVFQTICSVFQRHGDQLSAATWDATLRSIFMTIAGDDARRYMHDEEDTESEAVVAEGSRDISKAIIAGTANIMAQNIRIIEQTPKLASLWEAFLGSMEVYLDAGISDFNSTVYSALARILSNVDSSATVWSSAGYRTVALWLKRVPEATLENEKSSNQESFIAYTEAARELYRLTRDSMGTPQLRKMVENLYRCVRDSDGPRYGADANNLSPLQEQVLSLLKDIRTDLANVPSCLISTAARFIVLGHDAAKKGDAKQGPTFVALGSASLDWLLTLLQRHMQDPEIVETGALVAGLQSLRKLVQTKYSFKIEHKGTSLWRKAIDVAVEIAESVLALQTFDSESRTSVWTEYVAITAGVVKANGLDDSFDPPKVYNDQEQDITAFRRLRQILTPRLGDRTVPQSCRTDYCQALFTASVVHTYDLPPSPLKDSQPLQNLTLIRRGRVQTTPYEARETMCYECFHELLSLSSGSSSQEETLLAVTAGPLTVLRLALPLKSFIADQPLRGKRPQPLSEEEELRFCCEQIESLDLNPDALGEDMGEKAHVPYLYPLLVKAAGVAGGRFSGVREMVGLLQGVLRAIAPPV